MRFFVSAGEASGDALGASLLRALRARVPELDAFGMGGPRMRAEGFEAIRDAAEVSIVGFAEVVRHLPRLFALRDALAAEAIARRPELAILIDVPDFNIRLARKLKAAGIPVVFYVGPSVWAWRPSRVKTYRKYIDRLLVLFPFEEEIWREAGVDVVCVGHPLLDAPALELARDARKIALLPGSRRSEIDRHLDVMLKAARLLADRGLADRFVLPVAPTLDRAELQALIPKDLRVELATSGAGPALASSAAAIVASGTATLEAALAGAPQVIIYRVSRASWWIGKSLARVRHLGLVNLIAGREIVPELLQDKLTAEAVVEEVTRLLRDARAMIEAYGEVRSKLGAPGAADRAADAVIASSTFASISYSSPASKPE